MKNYQHKLGPRLKPVPAEVHAALSRLFGIKLYYTTAEVAEAIGVTPQTIRRNAALHNIGKLSKRAIGTSGIFMFNADAISQLCLHVAVPTYTSRKS